MMNLRLVFYFLKCGQNGLPVACDGLVINGLILLNRRSAQARIEQCLRQSRTDRPDAARSRKPLGDRYVLKASRTGQIEIGIERGLRHSDSCIGTCYGAPGTRDVGAPLKQLGRNPGWYGWHDRSRGISGDRES